MIEAEPEKMGQGERFAGFLPEDFDVFAVPGFEARMSLLRAQIKPKIAALGQELAARLSETMGQTLFPHVAQHLRRTVNPPEETWVAFSRSPRSYKPFTHLRVAVSGKGAQVLVFVEDEADDKPLFAANLERNADALASYLGRHPTLYAYDLCDAEGEPKRGHALDADTLRGFAGRLKRLKGQHARFGPQLDRSHPVLQSGAEFIEAVLEASEVLKPLYDCGVTPEFTFTEQRGVAR